ncbi:MAG: mechanosensitive ion channel family protein [Haloarculaceae archaeon]
MHRWVVASLALQATATPPPTGGSGGVWTALSGALPPWIPASVVRLVTAIVLFAAAWYGSRLLTRVFGRRVARRFQRPSVTRTVLRSMRLSALAVAALVGLAVLGFHPNDLTLSVGVFSAVVGIVLAPIVGSVISGFFVLADQPYEIGDMIELVDRGQTGFVEDITLRYTKIFTLDNTFLVVPNGSMRERDVINYSAEDGRTRLSLDVLVTYESDLAEARRVAEEAARSVDNVIQGGPDIRIGSARYPAAPTCYIESYADHGVLLRLRYWVQEPYKLLTMRSKVQTEMWERMSDVDVEFAYPHSHLVFDETSGRMQVDVGSGDQPAGERDRATRHGDRSDDAATREP